jgi:hypothetical protein
MLRPAVDSPPDAAVPPRRPCFDADSSSSGGARPNSPAVPKPRLGGSGDLDAPTPRRNWRDRGAAVDVSASTSLLSPPAAPEVAPRCWPVDPSCFHDEATAPVCSRPPTAVRLSAAAPVDRTLPLTLEWRGEPCTAAPGDAACLAVPPVDDGGGDAADRVRPSPSTPPAAAVDASRALLPTSAMRVAIAAMPLTAAQSAAVMPREPRTLTFTARTDSR